MIAQNLASYSRRIEFLERNLISEALTFERKNPTAEVPDNITDLIKSYVVLTYGETEEFVETASLANLDHVASHLEWMQAQFEGKIKIRRDDKKTLATLLEPLLTKDQKQVDAFAAVLNNDTKISSDVVKRLFTSLSGTLKSMRKDVYYNNGLNSKDLEKLFDRAGFDTANRYSDLRNDLDILTHKRCRFAHTGNRNASSEIQQNMPEAVAANYLPTAAGETKKVKQIVNHLTNLVNELRSLPGVT